jgi:excisionase family DNA binding protein
MSRETKITKALGVNHAVDASAILTVDQVATRLQITKAGVYELTRFRQAADTPRLPARKIGRSLRFIAAEIDEWVLSLPQHTHLQKRRYIKKDAPAPAAPLKTQQKNQVAA